MEGTEVRTRGVAQLRAIDGGAPGRFEAVVSVFGNVDSYGDRMIFGAFQKSLETRGYPPIVWTHRWDDPPIGVTHEAEEAKGITLLDGRKVDGLRLLYQLLVDDNPTARAVDAAQRAIGGDGQPALREYSFAFYVRQDVNIYDQPDTFEPVDARHWRDLLEVDMVEAGPTLIGANSETGPVALLSQLSRRRELRGSKAARAILDAGEGLLELRAGAVLSSANRARVENAITALQELLADADKGKDEDGKNRETDETPGADESRSREVTELLSAFPV